MAELETACQTLGIGLFILPPRSPKLYGAVERAKRTHTEEFYEGTTAEPDVTAFRTGRFASLGDRIQEIVYNTIRPRHSAT